VFQARPVWLADRYGSSDTETPSHIMAIWSAVRIICYHAAFARQSFRFSGNQAVFTGRVCDFTRYPVFYRQR